MPGAWRLRLLLGLPAAARGGLAARFDRLPFAATDAPAHTVSIGVGVYFEHLFKVDSASHTFDADFWLTQRWHDDRNFTALFEDNRDAETEQRTRDAMAPSAAGRRYLELGHGAKHQLWHPDLHIHNCRSKSVKVHAEFSRLYDDGTVELIQFIFAELELQHPYYGAFPFDLQHLSVQISSLAHTTKQILVTPLLAFTGVNVSLIAAWPGWVPVSTEHTTIAVEEGLPDYAQAAGNEHRDERRSRFHMDIEVERQAGGIVKSSFLPLFLQVAITWTSFFINVKVLMPRVAVAFISYLSLGNLANHLTSELPTVSYEIWLGVFIQLQRLMVVLVLLETACVFYVTEHVSTRVGVSLDCLARVLVPLDYIIVNAIFIGMRTQNDRDAYEARLVALEAFAWANFAILMFIGGAWCLWSHRNLLKAMRRDPVQVYRSAERVYPLDSNETRMLFKVLDNNGNGILELKELAHCVATKTGNGALKTLAPEIVLAVTKALPSNSWIDYGVFHTNCKAIMGEISLACAEQMGRRSLNNLRRAGRPESDDSAQEDAVISAA